jgi:hypothetical protein
MRTFYQFLADKNLSEEKRGFVHPSVTAAHEKTADAYPVGLNAIRSGDKELHADAAKKHGEAGMAHRHAAENSSKDKQRAFHAKWASRHDKSANMHVKSVEKTD